MLVEFPPLLGMLAEVPDPRHRRGRRYDLVSVLGLLCVGSLCGYRSYGAISEWGRNYGARYVRALGFRCERCPCKSTLCMLLRRLDVGDLEERLSRWVDMVMSAVEPEPQVLEAFAMDGKTLRGSAKQGARFSELLGVLGHRLGMPVLQRRIPTSRGKTGHPSQGEQIEDTHTNEIPIVKSLLRALLVEGRLEGRIFTMDAAHTQRQNATTLVEGGGHYVMPVKGNQPHLLEDIKPLFESDSAPEEWFQVHSEWDQGHGRIEHRRIRTSAILTGYLDWPGVQQVFELRRHTHIKKHGQTREDTVYGITSLPPEEARPDQLLNLVRGHWAIENRLHWVRDVTFDEDRSQVRSGHTPQVMAAIRNAAITIIRAAGFHNVAAACRQFAAMPNTALELIGATIEN